MFTGTQQVQSQTDSSLSLASVSLTPKLVMPRGGSGASASHLSAWFQVSRPPNASAGGTKRLAGGAVWLVVVVVVVVGEKSVGILDSFCGGLSLP